MVCKYCKNRVGPNGGSGMCYRHYRRAKLYRSFNLFDSIMQEADKSREWKRRNLIVRRKIVGLQRKIFLRKQVLPIPWGMDFDGAVIDDTYINNLYKEIDRLLIHLS